MTGTLWKHRKGGRYAVLCLATREADRTTDVVYQCERTGVIYTRPASEFLDGRFKKVGRRLA